MGPGFSLEINQSINLMSFGKSFSGSLKNFSCSEEIIRKGEYRPSIFGRREKW
jgi:hypothetical protein